ncbi:uncharacterized protein [Dysidea avara]|uniref:uncharacterized protein isoform X1 n=1 Tax=Dysidea avara TaxID=196820 RepID=UPI003326FF6A
MCSLLSAFQIALAVSSSPCCENANDSSCNREHGRWLGTSSTSVSPSCLDDSSVAFRFLSFSQHCTAFCPEATKTSGGAPIAFSHASGPQDGPKLQRSPAPAQRPCQEPLWTLLICFPPSNFDLICIQLSASLPISCGALLTNLLTARWISHIIPMSMFCRSSSGMSLTSSRHSSLVAYIQCCACSVIRSSRSSGHSSGGWRPEDDAEADNVVGSKSSCGVLVLLSDGAGLVDVVGILIAGVGVDIVGMLTATIGGDTDAAEVDEIYAAVGVAPKAVERSIHEVLLQLDNGSCPVWLFAPHHDCTASCSGLLETKFSSCVRKHLTE